MKKTMISFLVCLTAAALLTVGCSLHQVPGSDTGETPSGSETASPAETADPLPTDTESDDVTLVELIVTYTNSCMIRANEIRSDAEYRFYRRGIGMYSLSDITEYERYLRFRELQGYFKEYIYLKIAVEDVISFSYDINQTAVYSDGTSETRSEQSGKTWIMATVTGVIDNFGENYYLNTSDLIGETIVFCDTTTFWNYQEGRQVKNCIKGLYEDYGYIPKPGETVIVQVARRWRDTAEGTIDSTEVIGEWKEWLDAVTACANAGDTLTAEMIVNLNEVNKAPYYDIRTFYPSINVEGKEINTQMEFEESLLMLDEYFQEKEVLDQRWRRGYYGDIMSPEINDVLRNISIGFE